MALAKDPKPHGSYYNNVYGGSPSAQFSDQSSPELFLFHEHHKAVTEESETSEKASYGPINNFIIKSHSSSISSTHMYHPEDAQHSVINFKSGYHTLMHRGGSFLSFEQNDQQNDCSIWEDFNCVDQSATSGTIDQDFGSQEFACFNKRPLTGESMQAMKRQCTSATKQSKPESTAPSKDPQSVAAKNRRERISERLKILQELVPNGSKVDLVTMLEKAISYVKFLQLQVKVLATDEFWPVQGGKAPDISQVKAAIDAILSSQKDTSSSSK